MRTVFSIAVTCLFVATVSAEIYRSVDEDGNIVFSDKPTEGAEKIEVQEAQTFEPSPETRSFDYRQPESEPSPRYRQVAISRPANDESVRQNNGNITVQVDLEPSLRSGDRLELYMDGEQVASGRAASIGLNNVDRGTHSLVVRVLGSGGRVLKESPSVTFHLLRHSTLSPSPPAGPLNPPGGLN